MSELKNVALETIKSQRRVDSNSIVELEGCLIKRITPYQRWDAEKKEFIDNSKNPQQTVVFTYEGEEYTRIVFNSVFAGGIVPVVGMKGMLANITLRDAAEVVNSNGETVRAFNVTGIQWDVDALNAVTAAMSMGKAVSLNMN